MRIGINGRFLRYPATGTGQHTLHLLSALVERDSADAYVLLGPGPRESLDSTAAVGAAAARLSASLPRSPTIERLQRLWWEQAELVAAAHAERVELLHAPYFSAPLMLPAPTVVTIHDVITLLLPEYRERTINRLYTWLAAIAVRRAAAIIAVSACSKRDISRVLGIPTQRIHVIGNAVDRAFRRIEDEGRLEAVRNRYGLPHQFVLYLGGFDLRKNLGRLLVAYGRLPPAMRSLYPLVVAGRAQLLGHPLYPDPRPLVERLGIGDSVQFVGELTEADKPAVYSAATVFVWPSLYEGFGIPVLEAMACGTPTITSSTSALPEVAGDAARLVDPLNIEALNAALAELLDDPEPRAELSRRGPRRAAQYTWDRVAEQTMQVYGSVVP